MEVSYGSSPMVELGTLANIAEIVGGIAVITGLAYAVWEVRRYQEQKRRDAAMRWLEAFWSREYARSIRRVWRLPDDADPALIGEDPEREIAVVHVVNVHNLWGWLVHEGVVPEELVASPDARVAPVVWRKTRRWVRATEEQGGSQPYRWFMWWTDNLADREFEEGPDPEALWQRLEDRDV